MNIETIVEKINSYNSNLVPLDSLQGNISNSDFVKLLKEFKQSKYCFPLIFNDNLRFNFITVPSWGTKHKHYIIDGASYSHIEKL